MGSSSMGTTAQRIDEHRPSAIRPEDYAFEFGYDAQPPMGWGFGEVTDPEQMRRMRETYEAMLQEHIELLRPIRESGTSTYNDPYRCDHCGAHMRYGMVYRHLPSEDVITVGEICAENTMRVPNRATLVMKRLREAAAAARMREAEDKEARERRELAERDYPEAVKVIRAIVAESETAQAILADRDAPLYEIDALPFLENVAVKHLRRGYLSERQAAAIVKGYAARQARQVERQEREKTAEPCPAGRIWVEGRVLSTKTQENDFGTRCVMTVEDDRGFRVWGTEPSTIKGAPYGDEIRGRRIKFKATIERSDRDEFFGFFKRPSNAEVL